MKIEETLVKRGYMVTEEGVLLNPKGVKIGCLSSQGYPTTCVRVKGKKVMVRAHRLQAFQKYGNLLYEEGIVVRHKNGIRSDNSWENILIGTQSDNMMDVPKQIRIKRAQHANSFLIKHNKEEIKAFHSVSKSYKETKKKFNISSSGTLHHILNN